MSERQVRIGIDVGGTFTHAVAINARTLDLAGKAKVPTSHDAAEGVARGVVDSLLKLLKQCDLQPADVLLIAHSTTQATNALLEGDVAPVGILGLGRGPSAWLARVQTAIAPIPLAPGRSLKTVHRFLHSDHADESAIERSLHALKRDGAKVIVAAEAFAVDDPRGEQRVCRVAERLGLPATATHHVSQLHGLRIRTRTAVINASMIPRMLATANMTEKAVREAGISAPLMIMRSDGGVMDIAEMRRRPILTMLSGPAAGVAAALLYARVSDGVFLEVGGTSTDVSVIKNGRCQIRSAEIGGQKLHLSTLDVRTIGVAGGSLVSVRNGRVTAVGPRSCHIAGLRYLSFAPPDRNSDRPAGASAPSAASRASWRSSSAPAGPELPSLALHADAYPFEGDSYCVVRPAGSAEPLAVTPTCASNMLELVPEGDPARTTHPAAVEAGFAALTDLLDHARGSSPAHMAEQILDVAALKVIELIEGFIRDYKLDRHLIRLIGGGGGASAIVPFVARKMGLPFENAPSADVISAIGVALALVRDSVERTVIDPKQDDIRQIREEAFDRVLRMGAAAETIQVFVEVDARRNLLRATAEGSTEIRQQDLQQRDLTAADRAGLVATSLATVTTVTTAHPTVRFAAGGFEAWTLPYSSARLWGLFREVRTAVRVLDRSGTLRWQSNHADLRASRVASAESDLADLAEQYTRYNDAGAIIPPCYGLLGGRIIDLSGLVQMPQVLEVLRLELKGRPADESCGLLVDLG